MSFRVAFVPGVTPTKWFRVWAERRPEVEIVAVPIDEAEQLSVLTELVQPGAEVDVQPGVEVDVQPGAEVDDDAQPAASGTDVDGRGAPTPDAEPVPRADVVFARLPIDREGLSAITLYAEQPVVVVAKDHAITALDESEAVVLADLPDERMLELGTGATAGPDAVELVAAGVGILVLPKSLARLWGRRDVDSRPVADAAETQIALVWRTDRHTELVEEFIGVVRGRTANSSRMTADEVEELRRQKPTAKAKAKAAEARAAKAKSQPAKKKVAGRTRSSGRGGRRS